MEVFKKDTYFSGDEKIYLNKSFYLPTLKEHSHEFLEIVFISEGSGIHLINHKEYKVTKGDLFFIDYKTLHILKPVTDDFRWINCLFLPEILDDSLIHAENATDLLQLMLFKPFFNDEPDIMFSINLLGVHKEFRHIFEEMVEEFTEKREGYRLILKSYLTVLLSKIFRYAGEKNSTSEEKSKKEVMTKVIEYLRENYSKPLKIEDIARQALLSPSYLAAVFKNSTGHSLLDYIHKIRVEEACRLLSVSSRSIYEVMDAVGYSDSKFFYNIFKRYTGMTPGMYKKRKK